MHTHRQFTRGTRSIVCLAAILAIAVSSARASERPNTSAEKEKELIAVLQSDAPPAEKAMTCKKLAIDGSSKAIPELAKLLPNPQLSSWSRIALEAIPGPEADEALRNAAESLDGLLLVGTINSIGVRRDAKAVEMLKKRLQDDDAEVAAAAAAALGNIANADATEILRESLAIESDKVRSAVAEGCVLCAERLHADGKSAEAVELYDQVRKAEVPQQRIIEATRGAILARGQDGIPLLREQFRSPEKTLFQLALGTAREFPGGEVDKALADELDRAEPERAAMILQAMADRPETVVLAAVLAAAEKGPKPVSLSALDALGRVGDASCLSSLLQIALDDDADLAQAAKTTLGELPSEKVDAQIVARLEKAEGKSYPLLLAVVGQRRIAAVPLLKKALEHSDSEVRGAALAALGETVASKDLGVLIEQVVSSKDAEDVPAARLALKTAAIRMPDREACAGELTAAVDRAPNVETKTALLEVLGAVGGTKALAAMRDAAKGKDEQLQDVSTRLLGEWMTADAAPVLLDLAKTTSAAKYHVRALRGYIRIARQFDLPQRQRGEMCVEALRAARRADEQKLVLEVLERYPNKGMLKLSLQAVKVPELKADATKVALAIARKLGNKDPEVAKLLSEAGLK